MRWARSLRWRLGLVADGRDRAPGKDETGAEDDGPLAAWLLVVVPGAAVVQEGDEHAERANYRRPPGCKPGSMDRESRQVAGVLATDRDNDTNLSWHLRPAKQNYLA